MLFEAFKGILASSVTATVFATIITVARPYTKKHFSAAWHYYAYIMVLATFALPIRFAAKAKQTAVILNFPVINEIGNMGKTVAITPSYSFDTNILAYIWVLVAIILFAFKLIRYGFFVKSLKRNSQISQCPETAKFTDKKVVVLKSDNTVSPMLLGIFKPTLVLPQYEIKADYFDNILSHEMTHLKRHDVLCKWFAAAIKCVHWFNPAIYLIARQIDIECEVSCDIAVVRNMTKQQEISYTETILAMVCGKSIPLSTSVWGSKNALKRRFYMIKNKFKVSKKAAVISVICIITAAAATVFATGMINSKITDKPKLVPVVDDNDKSESESVQTDEEPVLIPTENSDDSFVTELSINDIKYASPIVGEISTPFGEQTNPITNITIKHNGIDIAAKEGSNVVSSIDGTVTDVGYNDKDGNYIVIEYGDVMTRYSALSSINVNIGDIVKANQVIGTVGNTGISTGAHLHFEVTENGEYIDPAEFIIY